MLKFRLDDLRHTAATVSLLAGVHPKVVSERDGNASTQITLDRYSHLLAPAGTRPLPAFAISQRLAVQDLSFRCPDTGREGIRLVINDRRKAAADKVEGKPTLASAKIDTL